MMLRGSRLTHHQVLDFSSVPGRICLLAPGNVRELENVLEAAFYLGGSHIQPTDLPDAIGARHGDARHGDARHAANRQSDLSTPASASESSTTARELHATPTTVREAMAQAERQLIEDALRAAEGNRTRAA
ncbi:hypothetical protein E0X81_01555, partial [Halomonas sp. GDM18]